jgi:hypothetical protein
MQRSRWSSRSRALVWTLAMAALLAPALPSAAVATEGHRSLAPASSQQSATPAAIPAGAITPRQAKRHIGRVKTVCGRVASTKYARYSNGRPTFLNLGKPYPNQLFTILIWYEYRSLYPRPPERMFRYKTVCVRGLIGKYGGVPQIVARTNKVWRP